jgi:hypothetical protein
VGPIPCPSYSGWARRWIPVGAAHGLINISAGPRKYENVWKSQRTHSYLSGSRPPHLRGVLGAGELERELEIIEAPWLVNGGHGASLRRHKGSHLDVLGEVVAPCRGRAQLVERRRETEGLAQADSAQPSSVKPRRGRKGGAIKAPWLLNGGHGASLRQHNGGGVRARGGRRTQAQSPQSLQRWVAESGESEWKRMGISASSARGLIYISATST